MGKLNVICNTSPIIGLMAINRLSLLWQLFDEIVIPQAVQRELCANSPAHPQEVARVRNYITEGRFKVYQVQHEEMVRKLYGKMASGFLIDTIGICGILTLAKKQGLIERIKPDLDLLRSKGYRISESLYLQILYSNGETQ